MGLFVGYEPAGRCSSGPTPGAQALMSVFLGLYQAQGGTNLGIFNCRTVRGGTTTSLHGEGRACDLGVKPHGASWGTQLADLLRLNSAELGVQCIIWNRCIWSGSYPQSGWRPYRGVNPHVDHLHVELSRHAAQALTAAKVHAVLSAGSAPVTSDLPVLHLGSTGRHVEVIQRFLGIAVDGVFGPATERAVRSYQQTRGLTVDGVVGPATWDATGLYPPAGEAPSPTPRDEEDDVLNDADKQWLYVTFARREDVGHARDQVLASLGIDPFAEKMPDLAGAALGQHKPIDPAPIVAAIVDAGIAEQVVEALAARLSRTD